MLIGAAIFSKNKEFNLSIKSNEMHTAVTHRCGSLRNIPLTKNYFNFNFDTGF